MCNMENMDLPIEQSCHGKLYRSAVHPDPVTGGAADGGGGDGSPAEVRLRP